jgi:hypothetical protein
LIGWQVTNLMSRTGERKTFKTRRTQSEITRIQENAIKNLRNLRNLRMSFCFLTAMLAAIAFKGKLLYKSGQFAARRQRAAFPRRR